MARHYNSIDYTTKHSKCLISNRVNEEERDEWTILNTLCIWSFLPLVTASNFFGQFPIERALGGRFGRGRSSSNGRIRRHGARRRAEIQRIEISWEFVNMEESSRNNENLIDNDNLTSVSPFSFARSSSMCWILSRFSDHLPFLSSTDMRKTRNCIGLKEIKLHNGQQ